MRYFLPLIILFGTKTINLKGASVFKVPKLYIGKKATLKIINASKEGNIEILVKGTLTNKGNLIVMREGESDIDMRKIEPKFNKEGELAEMSFVEESCSCECHYIDSKHCTCDHNCNKPE